MSNLKCGLMGVAVVLALSFPHTALANPVWAPGDDPATAIELTPGVATTGTLSPAQWSSFAFAPEYFKMRLAAGQTIAVTYTASEPCPDLDMMSTATFTTGLPGVYARKLSPTSCEVVMLAPKSGDYWLMVAGRSAPGTYTVEAAQVTTISYSLSKVSGPGTGKRRRPVTVRTTLIGRFVQLEMPVRFILQRSVRGRWKAYGSASATRGTYLPTDSTVLRATLRLPRGRFRIRARFADAAHSVSQSTKWKPLSVK